jgi:hypothetical protein
VVLEGAIEWRHRQGDHDLRVDRVEEQNGRVAVVVSWAERDGTRHEWANLLRFRGGMITHMDEYAGGDGALRALRGRRPWWRGRAG